MKDGLYAVYLGKEYTSGKTRDGKIILRSDNERDVDKGFEPCEPFTFRKQANRIVCIKNVDRSEVDEYYRARTIARYEGHDFEVIDETDKEISIVAMAGDYRDWLNLGMKVIDKGVYQKWIPKEDAEIRVIKEPL